MPSVRGRELKHLEAYLHITEQSDALRVGARIETDLRY